MIRKTRTAAATLAGLTILTGVTLTQLPGDGPGRVTASAETPPPVEDVTLPTEVASPDTYSETPTPDAVETPQTPEETTTVPPVPEPAPEPSQAVSCNDGYALTEDGSCVPETFWDEDEPEETQTPETIHEDDPRWDCRVHGNGTCGVQVEDTWYVVTFDDAGKPLTITERGW